MKDLDEAIIHCEQKAKELKDEANSHCDIPADELADCLACAADHEQLAAWLRELKVLRETKANSEQEAKQYALGYQEGFLDAKKMFVGGAE